MTTTVTLKRTFFRTFFLLVLFFVLSTAYRSSLQPISNISLLQVLSNDKAARLVTFTNVLDIIYFLSTFLCIHLIWAYIITISCKSFFNKIYIDSHKTLYWLIITFLHINYVLALNSYYYPTSLLGFYRHSFFTNYYFIIIFTIFLLLIFFNELRIAKKWKTLISTFILSIVLFSTPSNTTTTFNSSIDKPNIFIIGLDGFRPDLLNSKNNIPLMPFLSQFLDNATIYENSYTPLPRTFVAWLSLLTSKYPFEHGGRFNLTPHIYIDKKIPLLQHLKANGYSSLYAIDERRFNHIDESYGFDSIVGPNEGAADKLITHISDVPQLNILSNKVFGKHFLPYIYLNRANGKTYDPILFNNEILDKLDANRPNFVSSHFCMLHWPFTSKEFINVKQSNWEGNYTYFMYKSLLEKLDNQLKHLINNLEKQGYLKNSIIYIISDHGDSFALSKDSFSPSTLKDKESSVQVLSWGHGTNVLDQSQARVLLASKTFVNGKQVNNQGVISGIFSLLDIVPTIYKKLNLPDNENFSGSVLPESNTSNNEERFLFVESSFPKNFLNTSFIDEKEIIYDALDSYEVNNLGNLVLTQNAYKHHIPLQHRSVYYKNWQLAYIPEYKEFILTSLLDKKWTFAKDIEKDIPIEYMKSLFCDHYQKDHLFDSTSICNNHNN